MPSILGSLNLAVRRAARSPLSTLAAVVALGLGVGLTTAAFSLLDAVFLRGLPLPEGDRLVRLERLDLDTAEHQPVTLRDFLALRQGRHSFVGVAAFLGSSLNVRGEGLVAERANGAFVTADLFDLVGVRAFRGRALTPADGRADAPPVAVLGYDLWRDRLGGDPAILGRPIRVEGELRTVVGIMPRGFGFPLRQELWIPLSLDLGEGGERGGMPLQVFGKRRPDVSLAQARAELAAFPPPRAEGAGASGRAGFTATPYVTAYTEDMRPSLRILLAAALGVWLIAGLNVTNLLLARAVERRDDLAVRTALGARRRQLVSELLGESLLLSALGAGLGLAVARAGTALYLAAMGGDLRSYWMEVRLDGRVLLFTLGIAALTALACGVIPGLRAAALEPSRVLQDARALEGRATGRLSQGLVVLEVALGAALLVALGLAVRSYFRLETLDPGFRPARILAGQVSLPASDYAAPERQVAFYDDATARLRATAGVLEVAWTSSLPGGRVGSVPFRLDGIAGEPEGERRVAAALVSPRFFATLGRGLVAGRDFLPSDSAAATPVALINQSFLRRYFPPGADPIGRRVQWGKPGSDAPWMTIVGVAPDVLTGPVEDWPQAGLPVLYAPLSQNPGSWSSLVVRTAGEPLARAADLRRAIAAVDPDLPLFWVDSLAGKLADGTASYRALGTMVAVFGLAALALAALGVYSVMALSVGRRQGEFGLRMALGAARRQIVELVLKRGGRQLATGFLVGLPLAWALGRVLAAQLYGVRAFDLVSFAAAAATLGAAGLAASLAPAWRAAQSDPAAVLRG